MVDIIIKGFFMGVAELIPGLGATTVALISGIFTKILDIINDIVDFIKILSLVILRRRNFSDIKKSFNKIDIKWLFQLLVGALLGIGIFVNIISYLLHSYENYVYAFILGPILFSIYILYSQINKFKINDLLFILIGFTITYILLDIVGITRVVEDPSLLLLFLGGFFAALAVLLPGISVPFVLILLGIYDVVINSVKNILSTEISAYSIYIVSIFIFGVIFGLIFQSKLFRYLLNRYESITLSLIIGIMMASIRVVNPFNGNENVLFLIFISILGLVIVYIPYYIINIKSR